MKTRVKRTFFLILFMALLIGAAWGIPELTRMAYDWRELNKITYVRAKVEPYIFSYYDGFQEKAEALNQKFVRGGGASYAVTIKEDSDALTEGELIDELNEELNKLHELKILNDDYRIEEIVFKQLYEVFYRSDYDIYAGEMAEGEISRARIWRIDVRFETKSAQIYRDPEFGKIYGVRIWEDEEVKRQDDPTQTIFVRESQEIGEAWIEYWGLQDIEVQNVTEKDGGSVFCRFVTAEGDPLLISGGEDDGWENEFQTGLQAVLEGAQ